jgi:tripartite ATP-independent transporter DctM subunit
MIGTILLITAVLLLVLFFAGAYVAAAIGIVALTLLTVFPYSPMWAITGIIAWNVNTTEVLLAIPLFVLAGELLTSCGITERVYSGLSQWLNPIPGGLLHTNIVASAVFASMCHSSAATTAAISTIALPQFRSRRYDERVMLGSVVAGGTLGVMIPPSVPMIVYSVLAEESIGRLYLAGIIPGLLNMLAFMLVIYIIAKMRPQVAPKEHLGNRRQRWIALISLLPVTILVSLVLGSMYLGVATPTEAASIGCVGSFGLALLSGNFSFEKLINSFLSMSQTVGMIMLITTAAFILQFALGALGVSSAIAHAAATSELSPSHLILVIMAIYLLFGCFMDSFAIIVTTVPILVPVLKILHVDTVWFGIIVLILNEAGLIHPPYGLNLFVIQGVRQRLAKSGERVPIADVYMGTLPYLIPIGIGLALIYLFPGIVLWLPNTVMGR